ncbi:hypothetical protein D9611_007010 [Ephemerocybe angulata]|uniref:Beta-glucuronidase C-terminal domain-containing protein n=1 Tax=Ephemerocybe angulata TaxID=980116 RepID=A0A8H5B1Z2_9AGAR|nr:hypothetical protein D9611_007010 [Tulosesus angulatus]
MLSSNLRQTLVALMLTTSVRALEVTISAKAPGGASSIAQDHVSLSIEQDRWVDWVGSTSRNEFFFNSLDNLDKLTGVPPRIRIGGQAADVANQGSSSVQFCNAYYDNTTISSNSPYPGAYSMAIGSDFYPTVRFLPKNTKVVTGVNYGANDDLRASVYISWITKAFTSPDVVDQGVTLEAIELGHEPDRYGKDNTFRSWDPKWSDTSAKYLPEWSNWVKNIIDIMRSGWLPPALDIPFWAGSISATGAKQSNTWTGRYLLEHNLLPEAIAPNVKAFSQHHYSGSICKGSTKDLKSLVTKSSIRQGLDALKEDIAAAKSKGLEYILGEANSFSCYGAAGVSNVAGSAIWALDYLLYASQLGISRVYFHQGVGYKFNFLQPTTLSRSPLDNSVLSPPQEAHIEPSYHAALIAAEAIGSSGQTRVAELPTDNSAVSGYAFYSGDKLTKALFINSDLYLKSDDSRSQARINVKIDGAAPRLATIKRLSVPHSDETSGLTWGGLSYETKDARPTGISRVEVLDFSEGFDLRATEVALISFD